MRHAMSAILASLLAMPAMAALGPGDTAPEFTAKASLAGKEFTYVLRDELKKGPVVVYFYPAAYTSGCNIQAHTFSENMANFRAAGATVVGVSLDKIATLNDFSSDPKYCAGKLPVASDADGKIAKSYQLKVAEVQSGIKDSRGMEIDHGFAERTTFIVTPDGKIHDTVGGVSAAENVAKTLAAVRQLHGASAGNKTAQ
jgi:peroxiredoxin